MIDEPKIGPTGDFPHGKLSPDDEGGINVAISHHIAPDGADMVRLDFGKPVAWLSLPRAQAAAFGVTILKFAGVKFELLEAPDATDTGQGGQGH